MDANEQWQFDAALAALSGDGRALTRSLQAKLERVPELRARFEARSPAPRGELVFSHGETEIARLQLKPSALPRLAFGGEPPRELTGLSQTTQAAERISKEIEELIAAAPQLGLFHSRK
jgi:hypothetical protein